MMNDLKSHANSLVKKSGGPAANKLLYIGSGSFDRL